MKAQLLLVLLFAILVTIFAKRRGYFRLTPRFDFYQITFFQLAGAFLVYFLVSLVFSFFKWATGWLNIVYLVVLFLAIAIYLFCIKRPAFYTLFWDGETPSWRRFWKSGLMGVVTLLISYPYVLFVNMAAKGVAEKMWGEREVEQVAVRFLKSTMDNPRQLILTLFCVIVLVPFVEEVLFRGFLQNWLRKYCKRIGAIFLTALIFSLVHYAPKQDNFEILSALFVLSCFLGFIYEREKALFASFALHSSFNALSSLMIFLNG